MLKLRVATKARRDLQSLQCATAQDVLTYECLQAESATQSALAVAPQCPLRTR